MAATASNPQTKTVDLKLALHRLWVAKAQPINSRFQRSSAVAPRWALMALMGR